MNYRASLPVAKEEKERTLNLDQIVDEGNYTGGMKLCL